MKTRAAFLTRLWIGASLAYGVVRVVLVWRYLGEYGVSPVAFAIVEVVSSALYGWSSSQVVLILAAKSSRRLSRMVSVTVISFLAPDVFVFATLRRAPVHIVRTVLIVVGTSVLVTAVGWMRNVVRTNKQVELDQSQSVR